MLLGFPHTFTFNFAPSEIQEMYGWAFFLIDFISAIAILSNSIQQYAYIIKFNTALFSC